MPHVIHWCGFAGAWLLVIGPLLQGATELDEETEERDELVAKLRTLPRTETPSPWWWLLPPVAYVRHLRQRRRQRQIVSDALETDELDSLQALFEKATAWLLVAGGASLIAISETWGLRESYGWAEWAFGALVVVMGLFCAGYAAYRAHSRRRRHGDARPSGD